MYTIKWNKILLREIIWINLKYIILRENNSGQNDNKHVNIMEFWNRKKYINSDKDEKLLALENDWLDESTEEPSEIKGMFYILI